MSKKWDKFPYQYIGNMTDMKTNTKYENQFVEALF